MQFYVHHINPHYAATWADTHFAGWRYGLGWEATPPVEPQFFELQCESLAAVRDLTEQLERKGHTLGEALKPASGWAGPAGPTSEEIRNAPPLWADESALQGVLKAALARGVTRFVAAAIFRCGTKVLVLQRRDDDPELAGFWEIPGGHVEPSESLLEGLKREIAEETGLIVPAAPHYSDFFDYRSSAGALTCAVNFLVPLDEECALAAHPEHVAYRWVDAAQVQLLHCSEEARRSLLKALRHGAVMTASP